MEVLELGTLYMMERFILGMIGAISLSLIYNIYIYFKVYCRYVVIYSIFLDHFTVPY